MVAFNKSYSILYNFVKTLTSNAKNSKLIGILSFWSLFSFWQQTRNSEQQRTQVFRLPFVLYVWIASNCLLYSSFLDRHLEALPQKQKCCLGFLKSGYRQPFFEVCHKFRKKTSVFIIDTFAHF